MFVAGNLLFLGMCYYSLASILSMFMLFVCLSGILINFFIGLSSDKEMPVDSGENYEFVSAETLQGFIFSTIAFVENVNYNIKAALGSGKLTPILK